MKKILEIMGMSAIVVDRCDICLLSERNEGCLLCRHPDGPYKARFDKCPLPNAPEETDEWPEDENHRLGPNGERLIAVDGEKPQFCGCDKCFYSPDGGASCSLRREFVRICYSSERADKRGIHWELAGDGK